MWKAEVKSIVGQSLRCIVLYCLEQLRRPLFASLTEPSIPTRSERSKTPSPSPVVGMRSLQHCQKPPKLAAQGVFSSPNSAHVSTSRILTATIFAAYAQPRNVLPSVLTFSVSIRSETPWVDDLRQGRSKELSYLGVGAFVQG